MNTNNIIVDLIEKNNILEKEKKELYERCKDRNRLDRQCNNFRKSNQSLKDRNKKLTKEKKDLLTIASNKSEISKLKIARIMRRSKVLQKSCYEKDRIISELKNEIEYLKNNSGD